MDLLEHYGIERQSLIYNDSMQFGNWLWDFHLAYIICVVVSCLYGSSWCGCYWAEKS